MGEIATQYQILERQARGAQTLNVTSARPLSAAELRCAGGRNSPRLYKTPFDVTQNVDPDLIGGVRLTMPATSASTAR